MTDSKLPEISVLVLCGGQSSRMGCDKALLEIAGETLLERTIRLGWQLDAAEVLVSRNAPGFIQDQVSNAGPMAGIAAALPYCHSRWLLVLPVDMPQLCPQALAPLLRHARSQQSCYVSGFPLPVLLENSAALQQALHQQLSDPRSNRSLQRLWQQLGYVSLQLPTKDYFGNANDPASFAAIRAQLQPTQRTE